MAATADRQAIRDFIASSNWFEGAPDAVLDKLASAATYKEFPANSYLWSMGEVNTEVFGVLSGRVRMYVSSAMGQEFALIDREEGSWLGEALLDDQGRAIGGRAMTQTEVVVIPRQVMNEVASAWPLLYRNLFHHQVRTSRGLYVLFSGVLFYPLRARVAGRLLDLLEEHGQQIDGGVLLDMKVSQNDFARLAMGSRQRVNRIFRDWDKTGLVVTRDDRLLVTDTGRLEQEVEPFE
jgi:CRP-like cAMP-binding protein